MCGVLLSESPFTGIFKHLNVDGNLHIQETCKLSTKCDSHSIAPVIIYEPEETIMTPDEVIKSVRRID